MNPPDEFLKYAADCEQMWLGSDLRPSPLAIW